MRPLGAPHVKPSGRLALPYRTLSSEVLVGREDVKEEQELIAFIPRKQCKVRKNEKKKKHAHDLCSEVQSLCQQGKLESALQCVLIRDRLCPTRNVYLSLLKACIQKHALPALMEIYAHLLHHKADLTGVLGDYLVVSLAKCGAVELARQMAFTLPHRTVYSWTAMIAAYTDSGQAQEALNMYHLMQEDGIDPDNYTFVSLLKACGSISDLEQGKLVHQEAYSMGFTSDVFVGHTLVSMYGKCGDISKAESLFCELPARSEVAYNALLSVYAEHGCSEKLLLLYRQMQDQRVDPNALTFAVTIQACQAIAENDGVPECNKGMMGLDIGRALHHDACNAGLALDAFVGNMLISMYGACGLVAEAESAFYMVLGRQDIKSWTQMLAVYVEEGQCEKALQFYRHACLADVPSDSYMFVMALQACTLLWEKGDACLADSLKETAMKIGAALRQDVQEKGFVSDAFVGTALLTMYGKFGNLVEAERIFDNLSQCTNVSWTAMLSAYLEQDEHASALLLHKRMQDAGSPLDDVSTICILQACSEVGKLDVCEQLHFALVCAGVLGKKASLPSTLVHCYASCGSMADAHSIFNELEQPDVVAWSVCITACAKEGGCIASLNLLEAMQLSDIRPNEVTFASVLSACSHAGLISEGLAYFDSMSADHSIALGLRHYVNMTDLLGRAGDFKKLEDILSKMPMQADLTIWLCLLGMCLRHGNVELGKQAFRHASKLQPTEAVTYVLMSNICADAQLDSSCKAEILNLEEGIT